MRRIIQIFIMIALVVQTAVFVAPAHAAAPAAPGVLYLDYKNATGVDVWWDAPADGGSPITGYVLEYKKSTDSAWTTFSDYSLGASDNYVSVSIADSQAKYEFRAAAVNADGTSPYSAVVETQFYNFINCTRDYYQGSTKVGETVTLTFGEYLNGVCYSAGYPSVDSDPNVVNPLMSLTPAFPGDFAQWTAGSYAFKALSPGKFEVGVGGKFGRSAGITILIYGKPEVPSAPTLVSKTSDSITVSSSQGAASTPASVGYTNPKEYIFTATPGNATCTGTGVASGSCTITGLSRNTEYTISVEASNDVGETSAATTLAVTTELGIEAPSSPTNLSAAPRNAAAAVTWSAPTSNGGSAITAYKVEYSADGTNWTTASSSVTETTFVVTGLTNGTQYSFRVSAYNGTEWSEPSTSATATPRGEADLLGPQVPETPLPLGQGNAVIDGNPVEISVEPNSEVSPSGLIMTGDGFSMSLAGVNRANQPLGLTPEGALILESDRFASVEGTGFKPLSEVQLYAFSEPRFLGSITTDANGGFNGKVQIPLDLPAGQHTLQANGLSPNDEVRSLSIGVLVREAKTRQLARNVYFAGGSSKITAVAAKSLRALVAGKKSAISQVRVTGFVQATTSTANDRALSAARARAVKVFLKKLGVKAQFTLKAAGAASASSTDRRSRVTITLDVT